MKLSKKISLSLLTCSTMFMTGSAQANVEYLFTYDIPFGDYLVKEAIDNINTIAQESQIEFDQAMLPSVLDSLMHYKLFRFNKAEDLEQVCNYMSGLIGNPVFKEDLPPLQKISESELVANYNLLNPLYPNLDPKYKEALLKQAITFSKFLKGFVPFFYNLSNSILINEEQYSLPYVGTKKFYDVAIESYSINENSKIFTLSQGLNMKDLSGFYPMALKVEGKCSLFALNKKVYDYAYLIIDLAKSFGIEDSTKEILKEFYLQ